MDATDQHKSPILDHLIELRRRVTVAAVAWLLAFGLCYYFADPIYGYLVKPLAQSFTDPEHKRLIFTGLTEAFMTHVTLAFWMGFFVAFPVLAWELYLFIAPGLYKKEKGVVLPYLIAAPLLFLLGAALAYYFVFPMAWKFFISFESPASSGGLPIQLEARVSDYLSLALQVIIAFGLAFQLPVLLTLMVRTGLITTGTLIKGRRYAVVILLFVAAVLTPPDILSQIMLFTPLYILYECSIFFCKIIDKQRDTSHA